MANVSLLPRFLSAVRRGSAPERLFALDVGIDAARALVVSEQSGELTVERSWVEPLSATGGTRAACAALLSKGAADCAVAVSIASPDTAIRRVELPPMTLRELHEALPWEAKRHVAGVADDAILDAQVLQPSPADEDSMSVLLVAFPRRIYDEVLGICEETDVDPVFVDLSPLSSMNAVVRATKESDVPFALLDLSSATGSFAIFTAFDLLLHRHLGSRLSRIDGRLASEFHLVTAEIEDVRRTGVLPSGDPPAQERLRRALEDVARELAEDLRAGRIYLENRTGRILEKVLVAGSVLHLFEAAALVEEIGQWAGLGIEVFDPLAPFRMDVQTHPSIHADAPTFSAAAGLAARFFDRP